MSTSALLALATAYAHQLVRRCAASLVPAAGPPLATPAYSPGPLTAMLAALDPPPSAMRTITLALPIVSHVIIIALIIIIWDICTTRASTQRRAVVRSQLATLVATVDAAHAGAKVERTALARERAAIDAERDNVDETLAVAERALAQIADERAALDAARREVSTERRTLVAYQAAARAKHLALERECATIDAERDNVDETLAAAERAWAQIVAERAALDAARREVSTERRTLVAYQAATKAKRKALVRECATIDAERDNVDETLTAIETTQAQIADERAALDAARGEISMRPWTVLAYQAAARAKCLARDRERATTQAAGADAEAARTERSDTEALRQRLARRVTDKTARARTEARQRVLEVERAKAEARQCALEVERAATSGERAPFATHAERSDTEALHQGLARHESEKTARAEAERPGVTAEMVRAEAQECQAELVVERWTLAADCKDFMNAWTEVGATQMALGAERAKIETARYDAAAARDMEQDSGSRAAFEAPDRGPATMPLGRRQRLRKAASTMFRGSKDKL